MLAASHETECRFDVVSFKDICVQRLDDSLLDVFCDELTDGLKQINAILLLYSDSEL
jgi:hypothetical protein